MFTKFERILKICGYRLSEFNLYLYGFLINCSNLARFFIVQRDLLRIAAAFDIHLYQDYYNSNETKKQPAEAKNMEKERIVLTTAEAAELTGISVLTIRRLCRTGKLKYVEAGHGWLVNRASLMHFLGEDGDTPSRAG